MRQLNTGYIKLSKNVVFIQKELEIERVHGINEIYDIFFLLTFVT